MRTTENISQLATALSLAQGQIQTASKDIDNAFYKSKYADIHSVWEACREPLSKNGLCVIQVPSVVEGRVRITTRLMHKSGEWIEEDLDLKPKEDTPQAIGSCITYGKRYMLLGMAGVTAGEDDDDGNKASFTTSKFQQKDKTQFAIPNQKSNSIQPPNINIREAQLQKLHSEFLKRGLSEEEYPALEELMKGRLIADLDEVLYEYQISLIKEEQEFSHEEAAS